MPQWFTTWFILSYNAVMQGAATTVYAAVSPDLEDQSGAYLRDCSVTASTTVTTDPEQARSKILCAVLGL